MSSDELVPEADVNPMVHLLAPIAAIGATMLVRRILDSSYKAVTGREAPGPRDAQARLSRVLLWTVVTTVTAAAVEVAVYRTVNHIGRHEG